MTHFQPLIHATVVRTARTFREYGPELVEDLAQDTYLRIHRDGRRLLRDLRDSSPPAVYGLIRAVAISTALDHFRTQSAQKRGGGAETLPMDGVPELSAPAGGGAAAVERTLLLDRIDRALDTLRPAATAERDRYIFWLYYRQGLTARDIAESADVGLSVKGVESALVRIIQHVKEELSAPGAPRRP